MGRWLGQSNKYPNPRTPAQLQAALSVSSGEASPDAVTAANAFGNNNRIILSDGTGRGIKASVVSIVSGVMSGIVDILGGLVINESGSDVDLRAEGDTLSHMLFLDGSAATENIALLAAAAPNWQSMDRGIFIGDTSTAPTGNPASGVFVWSESGELKARDGSGNVTTLTDAATAGAEIMARISLGF